MFEVNENISIEIKKCYDHCKGNDYGYIWRKVFIIDDFYQNPDAVRATVRSHTPKYEKEYCGNLIGGRVVAVSYTHLRAHRDQGESRMPSSA